MSTSARNVLHVMPGDSATGSLRQALLLAGLDDDILTFLDDLSCGPIASDDPAVREEWWGFEEDLLFRERTDRFWETALTTTDPLVVWFSRHCARELAFLHAWVDRMGDRAYAIIDATGAVIPYEKHDGSSTVTCAVTSLGLIQPNAFRNLFGTERVFQWHEKAGLIELWHTMKREDAPFRVVTDFGLASAPADYFDRSLLDCASVEWTRAMSVIGESLGRNYEPYVQVGDVMLAERMITLVAQGQLLCDGDTSDLRSCRVRLPQNESSEGAEPRV